VTDLILIIVILALLYIAHKSNLKLRLSEGYRNAQQLIRWGTAPPLNWNNSVGVQGILDQKNIDEIEEAKRKAANEHYTFNNPNKLRRSKLSIQV